jgi:glycosyltransferase involved in cell wall biosynthesis
VTRSPQDSGDSLPLSVIIPVYNDWRPLDECLRSLAAQIEAPDFEVLVIDDGSREVSPDYIREWSKKLKVAVIRQGHAGISAARNRGVKKSNGRILVFVDADCKLRKDCLAELHSALSFLPDHNYFQLRLIGDVGSLIGRAEELRLLIIQKHMLRTNGCIRYLNTAGFAMRRESAEVDGVFEPDAKRAEDTLFLLNLMRDGELPYFVDTAVVKHAIPLTLAQCMAKDLRSNFLEARAYDKLATRGVKFRVSHSERVEMLRAMWKVSAERPIGRGAWCVVAARQAIRLVTLVIVGRSIIGGRAE